MRRCPCHFPVLGVRAQTQARGCAPIGALGSLCFYPFQLLGPLAPWLPSPVRPTSASATASPDLTLSQDRHDDPGPTCQSRAVSLPRGPGLIMSAQAQGLGVRAWESRGDFVISVPP